MDELLTPIVLYGTALGCGVAGLAALVGFGERRFSIANLLLGLGFLGLVGGGMTGIPGSPLIGAPWGELAAVGGAAVTILGALFLVQRTGGGWKNLTMAQASLEAKKRDLNRVSATNVRLEDEIQELRGRLARAELEREKQRNTGDSARQQRATLARISAREKRHREVFEHAHEGMATLEKETLRLAEVNEALAGITGYSKEDLGRKSLVELFTPGENRPGRLDLQRSARDGRPLNVELQHVDGHAVPVEVNISVIGDGASRQLLAIVRDVTQKLSLETELQHHVEQLQERERRLQTANQELAERTEGMEEMNRRLQELQEVKDHFLSSVTHELRAPLTSIRSFSEILLKHGDSDPEVRREFLHIINKESERLTRLVTNVLDLGKIEAGQEQIEVSEFDAREVLNDAIKSMAGMAAARKVRIVKAWPSDPRHLFADRDKVQQLVMNLLSNAVKFSPNGSQVVVVMGSGAGPGRVEISVRDRGPGIPQTDLERIFDKYHQVGESGQGTGTGLGLTICHEIAELHGANIWAESEAGRGSIFRVDFPNLDDARSLLGHHPPAPPRAVVPRTPRPKAQPRAGERSAASAPASAPLLPPLVAAGPGAQPGGFSAPALEPQPRPSIAAQSAHPALQAQAQAQAPAQARILARARASARASTSRVEPIEDSAVEELYGAPLTRFESPPVLQPEPESEPVVLEHHPAPRFESSLLEAEVQAQVAAEEQALAEAEFTSPEDFGRAADYIAAELNAAANPGQREPARVAPISRPVTVEAISDMIKDITDNPEMSETGTLPPLGDWWQAEE